MLQRRNRARWLSFATFARWCALVWSIGCAAEPLPAETGDAGAPDDEVAELTAEMRCIDCPNSCEPDCTDAVCGAPDGCGGRCRTGACPAGAMCRLGRCVCAPSCLGKACGDPDGCGGVCESGRCAAGYACRGGHCECVPDCANKACGAGDGCGGICTTGSCPNGSFCGADGVPGRCGGAPVGQGVECFVFDDGGARIAGPSSAIYVPSANQACIPDGTSTGTCRRWFGECRTSDASHTPVSLRVFDDGFASASSYQGAVYIPGSNSACVPDETSSGTCRRWFGDALTASGQRVECAVFDDGDTNLTALSDAIFANGSAKLCVPGGANGVCRKWFGRCVVAGCGDGTCNQGESCASCPSDCGACPRCGDGKVQPQVGEECDRGDGNNTGGYNGCTSSCRRGPYCGDGVLQAGNGEQCDLGTASNNGAYGGCTSSCKLGPRCGDGACSGGETCSTCAGDCGSCPTCSSGSSLCGGSTCISLNTPQNCGSCGRACPFGQQCVNGACTCPFGELQCGGTCCAPNGCLTTRLGTQCCPKGVCGDWAALWCCP